MRTYFFFGTRMPEYVKRRIDAQSAADAGPLELAPHLFYLGSAGIAMVDELRIAFCGGVWGQDDVHVWRKPTGSSEMPAVWTTWDDLDTATKTSEALARLLQHPALALGEACAPTPPTNPESLQQARAWQFAQAQFEYQLEQDVPALEQRKPIDFLLTNAWPLGIDALSKTIVDDASPGLAPIARLAEACRPRYHITHATNGGDGVYWEREPYENWPFAKLPPPPTPPITRFISLARAANESKRRWFIALQVVPSDLQEGVTAPMPPGTTPMPLWQVRPKPAPPKPAPKRSRASDDAPSRRKRRAAPIEPSSCWFCLSNPDLEKHLIVAIGTECYIALPKGQLPSSGDEATLVPGGGHVLIVPIAHTPSPYAPDTSSAALRAEIGAWKRAITDCYASFDAIPVTWEVVRRGTRVAHTQTQVVPIPAAQHDACVEFVREAAERDGWQWEKDPVATAWPSEHGGSAQDRSDYLYMSIGDTPLLLLLRGERFNMQFARETLAAFLGMPERADWRACAQPPDIEAAECNEFKDALAEFAEQIVS